MAQMQRQIFSTLTFVHRNKKIHVDCEQQLITDNYFNRLAFVIRLSGYELAMEILFSLYAFVKELHFLRN